MVPLLSVGCDGSVPEPDRAENRQEASHHHSHHHGHHEANAPERERPAPDELPPIGASEIPAKVERVLRTIDQDHRAPPGYEGGRVFHNEGARGEQPLPTHDRANRPIEYREWDVNPNIEGENRGAERLVTGSDGSAYFTHDHYRTFKKVR
jgi:guanyl-specific ribonuclease Sa